MNLQAYANHRKALGLRGTSHVAVRDACLDGRLTPPAVRREGRNWIIDADLADEQWATRTDPSEKGAMGGGTARPIGIAPAAAPTADQSPAVAKGGPSLAVSKQVKAAYEAKLTELEFKQRNGELVSTRDVKSQAFTLARAVRDGMMGIADRLAPQLAAATDPRQVHAMLTTEIRVALRALADG
jgi:hypothetical protein